MLQVNAIIPRTNYNPNQTKDILTEEKKKNCKYFYKPPNK